VAPPESARATWRSASPALVLVLGALAALGPLSMDMYLPGLPSMAGELGASASAAQLTLTGSMLGLALGQVLAGPVSDVLGRRRPLLVGLAAFIAASVACALAPTIASLVGLRVVQGFAGAAAIVIARAIVRDLVSGVEAARLFALLFLVAGAAPILAPLVGGQLLFVTDWRGVFLVLGAIGAVLLAAVSLAVPETLAPERRQAGGLRRTMSTFRQLVADSSFVACGLGLALPFAAMAAYIAGSAFVLQEVYGLSPQAFSAAFAVNAVGIVVAAQAGRALLGRVTSAQLLTVATATQAVGAIALATAVATGAGLAVVLPSLFVVVGAVGLSMPSASALALDRHPEVAGSASALLGLAQFGLGAAVVPLVGIAGPSTATPMVVCITALALGGVLAAHAVRRTEGEER
jgi:DHA1 family bicyclomycin/chloramphenicol resistance-like MFS transporter